MKAHIISRFLIGGAAAALGACGGGGGGGEVASIPPAPVAPAAPPPAPTAPLNPTTISPFPGVTASTSFAALGAELPNDPTAPVRTDGFDVRYDASTDRYIFDLPAFEPGSFHLLRRSELSSYDDDDPVSWFGALATSPNGSFWPHLNVLKPSPTNPRIQLTYTSYAWYIREGDWLSYPHGVVAFGIATPQGGVPVTGTASYAALIDGFTSDRRFIKGTAGLQFDFGAGRLSGHLDPILAEWEGPIALGRYEFVNTIYSAGSTSFSGQLSNPNVSGAGSFSGQFTGPLAQELMARWNAPYATTGGSPDQQMFGILVGKRQ